MSSLFGSVMLKTRPFRGGSVTGADSPHLESANSRGSRNSAYRAPTNCILNCWHFVFMRNGPERGMNKPKPTPARPTKPEADLAQELDHPLYEIWMMLEATKALRFGLKSSLQMNFELESFVIHARCLDEFFASRSTQADSMWATDFILNFSVAGMDGADLSRMHGEVAHLTYRRKKSGDRGEWAINRVGTPIFEASLKFLKELKDRPALMGFATNQKRTLDLITDLETWTKQGPQTNIAPGTTSHLQMHQVAVTGYAEPTSSLPAPDSRDPIL